MTAGAVIPLSFAFIGDNVPYERRQTVLAQFITGTLLGQTLGPLLGGIFSDSIGWRATFLIPACAFLAIGVLIGRGARSVVTGCAPRRVLQPGDPLRPPAESPACAHRFGGGGDRGVPVLRRVRLSGRLSASPVRLELYGDRTRAGRVWPWGRGLRHAGAHAGPAPGTAWHGGRRRGGPADMLCHRCRSRRHGGLGALHLSARARILHAPQHAADARHRDGARSARLRRGLLRVLFLPRAGGRA